MRILYVVHSIPPLEYTGTPLIALQYATQAARRGDTVAVAYADFSGGAGITLPHAIVALPLAPAAGAHWTLGGYCDQDQGAEAALVQFRRFQPDLVHIVDWVHLPAGVLTAIKALEVPVIRHVWNLEDFCSFIEPIRYHPEGRPCEPPFTLDQCSECLVRRLGNIKFTHEGPIDQAIAKLTGARNGIKKDFMRLVERKWQTMQSHLTDIYDHLVFPTASFAGYVRALTDLGSIEHSVIEHGTVEKRHAPPARPPRTDGVLRCVFLGPCIERKGWALIEECFARLIPESAGRVTLKVFGVQDEGRQSPLRGLPGVELAGPYKSEMLPGILAESDLGLVPSLFETFTRVCREMLAQGVPVVGSNAFGIPDIVEDGVNGLLIGEPDADSLLAAIRRVRDEPTLLAALSSGASSTPIRAPADEFGDLTRLYLAMLQ